MKRLIVIVLGLAVATAVRAADDTPLAGTQVVGVSATVVAELATGLSVKRSLLGKTVVNDATPPQNVGRIDDLIIDPEKNVSYAIVGAGGFLGVARHDIAIPANAFSIKDGKIVLAGATKAAIEAMPQFQYATQPSSKKR